MMDTVLNLGLKDETALGLAAASGDERFFPLGSDHRFIEMYSDVVLGLCHGALEEAFEITKEDHGYTLDTRRPPTFGRSSSLNKKTLFHDLASIAFREQTVLDYVSVSPYRAPIVRRAVAQAAVRKKIANKIASLRRSTFPLKPRI
jgi:phosphoenolpyruvate synthase/pyruvate phosphate dikinase